MRTPKFDIAIAALAFGALTACAQPPHVAMTGMTSTTSSELGEPAAPAPREDRAERHEAEAAPSSTPAAAPVEGQLVCKTKDAFGVVTELYAEGDKGTLRSLAPSGNVEEKRLKIERLGNVIFADEPSSEDLAVHAVTLRHAEGKTFLRQGDWNQAWSACQ